MFVRECICQWCGRRYAYDYRKGHTQKRCNSCRTNVVRKIQRRKERLVELMGGACEICGYRTCLRVLSFHHLDPATKRFNIAGSLSRSWRELESEASRCALLCMNCHVEVENGVTEVPLAVRRRVELATGDLERRQRRRPGRPSAA
jgi:hypothetical protein